jgi:hypothetical protein
MEARADVHDYLNSLDLLGGLKPDLWLPAVPLDGQNANLYDNQWAHIIAENRSVIAREPFIRVSSAVRGGAAPRFLTRDQGLKD